MTASIPRYVRVEYAPTGWLGFPFHHWIVRCLCGGSGTGGMAFARRSYGEVATLADEHARRCLAVRAAMERDRYKAALESCEAAYAEAVRTLRRQRDEAREARDSLRDGLGRSEATLNRLTDQLATERRVCRVPSHDQLVDKLDAAKDEAAGLRQLFAYETGRTAEAHAERDRLAAEVDRLHGELETARERVWALTGEASC